MFLFIRKNLSKLRIEEWLALALILIASISLLLLGQTHVPLLETLSLMLRYFTFGDDTYFVFFIFIWGIFIVQLYFFLARLLTQYFNEGIWGKDKALYNLKVLLSPLRYLLPLAITFIPLYALTEVLSYQLRNSGHDLALYWWDSGLFGQAPFLWLSSLKISPIIETIIFYSYIELTLIISATLILLFCIKKKILIRRFILSFLLSLTIAAPFYFFIPCQDPNNFFLRNLRQKKIPSDIQSAIAHYNPSTETATVIRSISMAETNTKLDNAVPISCFPSGHAMWAIFVVYYLSLWSVWTLPFSVTWLGFLLFGGLYFAQHYAVDYLAAFPIALLCIFLANKAIPEENAGLQTTTPPEYSIKRITAHLP